MKKHIKILGLLFVLVFNAYGQENKQKDSIQTPKFFKLMAETNGDLDKDGTPEKVIVYDTNKETDLGTERQLYIYKKNNDTWEVWKTYTSVILSSKYGGMMGDPFQKVSIEKNCIVINHTGGSRHRWDYVHRFRFQNNAFELIGATIYSGATCDYSSTFDYNLSNGKIVYTEETEDCSNAKTETKTTNSEHKLKILPQIKNFEPGSNEVKLPNTKIVAFY